MKSRVSILSAAILAALASGAASGPASARNGEQSQEVEIYAGYLVGDDLLDAKLSNATPRLDDHATFGARYTFNFDKRWGVQISSGYTPTRVVRAVGGNVDLELFTADVDAVVNFTPDLTVGGHKIATYAVAGAGYAQADLDRRLAGSIGSTPVAIDDDRGFTANAGLGAKFFVTEKLFAGIDARYRYLDKLVDSHDHNLNTAEATLSVGYRF